MTTEPKDEIQSLCGDGQDPAAVERICSRIRDMLTSSETIDYVAIQKRVVRHPIPDAAVVTNRRLILYRPKLLGRVQFQDHPWRDLGGAHLEEGFLGSTLSLQTVDGEEISIEHLPKPQARRLYGLAQERDEEVREEFRRQDLEVRRAVSGGIVVHGEARGRSSATPAGRDPVERLRKLKEMLDAGLISFGEYEAKRAEILSGM